MWRKIVWLLFFAFVTDAGKVLIMPSSIFPVHRFTMRHLAAELVKRNHEVTWFEYGLQKVSIYSGTCIVDFDLSFVVLRLFGKFGDLFICFSFCLPLRPLFFFFNYGLYVLFALVYTFLRSSFIACCGITGWRARSFLRSKIGRSRSLRYLCPS